MKRLSGDHRVLTDVYFIPHLRSNIISLGQLDENGCKYAAENGVMQVWDQEKKCQLMCCGPEAGCMFWTLRMLSRCA